MLLSATPSLIYIAGYGRSGSTLLDTILGNHPQIFGAGELTWLFQHAHVGKPCCCGTPLPKCEFWSEVLRNVFALLRDMSLKEAAEVTLHAEKRCRSNLPSPYRRLWKATLCSISQISGKPILVDSSKSCRLSRHRLLHLQQCGPTSTKVVHLVRDPRGVMWSARKGGNRQLLEGRGHGTHAHMVRSLLSWMVVNRQLNTLLGRLVAECESLSARRIRYEDLTQRVPQTFAELASFLEIPLDGLVQRITANRPLATAHGIAGNRMRHRGPIVLAADEDWVERLPATAKLLSRLATPLMKEFDYETFPTARRFAA